MITYPVSTDLSRTIINALTTTFTPAASCSFAWVGCSDELQCGAAYQGQTCSGSSSLMDVTSCWPAASSGAPTPSAPYYGWGFYSPGLYCPSGYASACTATAGGSSQWSVEFSMEPGETAVGCCPSGFECAWGNGQTCTSTATTSQSFEFVSCSESSAGVPTLVTLPFAWTFDGTVGTSSSFSLNAPMIEIRWQATDRAQPMSTSGPSAPFATVTSTASMSMTATPTATSTPSTQAAGLSVGAEAAIGVVVPVVVILIAAAALLFWRRRRRNSKEIYDHVADHNGSDAGSNERGGKKKNSFSYNPELDSVPMHEMHVQEHPHEIMSEDQPIELSADSRH